MRRGSTPIDKRPTSPVENPANNTGNSVEIHEVWGWLHSGILPEAIFVLCCFTRLDMRKEDGFVLKSMYLEGFWKVELDHTLKFAKERLLDQVFGSIVVGVAVNETFVL